MFGHAELVEQGLPIGLEPPGELGIHIELLSESLGSVRCHQELAALSDGLAIKLVT
jgi:hypothetical protein